MSSNYASKRSTYGDLFSDEELGVVRHLVHEYRRTNRCLLWVHGFDELVQDCLVHWLDVRETYNAEKGASQRTYMSRVVENFLRGRIRHLKTQKLEPGWSAALFSAAVEKESSDRCLGDVLKGDEDPEKDLESEELATALDDAMAALTDRQRQIAEAKADQVPMTQIAKELRISRDTVYADLRRIRKVFEDKGLRRFLS